MNVGDKVRVVNYGYCRNGQIGTVTSTAAGYENRYIQVSLPDTTLLMLEGEIKLIEFNPGDTVLVTGGRYEGQTGRVIPDEFNTRWNATEVLLDIGTGTWFQLDELELAGGPVFNVGDAVMVNELTGVRWNDRVFGKIGKVTHVGDDGIISFTVDEPGGHHSTWRPARQLTKINNKELWV